MLDERRAFVERKDETHDPNGFAMFCKRPSQSAQAPLLFVVVYFAAELQRKHERTALEAGSF